jgi:hypothetical protein
MSGINNRPQYPGEGGVRPQMPQQPAQPPQMVGANGVPHRVPFVPRQAPGADARNAANVARQDYLNNYWNTVKGMNNPTAWDGIPLDQQTMQQLQGNLGYNQQQLADYNSKYGQADGGGPSFQQQQLQSRMAAIQAAMAANGQGVLK